MKKAAPYWRLIQIVYNVKQKKERKYKPKVSYLVLLPEEIYPLAYFHWLISLQI